jgi:hypothetical protein
LEQLLHAGVVREHTQLHSLLRYLGFKSLEEPAGPLKEYTIGIEALGKPEDYDPRLDPTVRVEVAKLRKRLKEYYDGAGASHRIRLTIPKGGYMPLFVEELPADPGTAVSARTGYLWPGIAAALLLTVVWLLWRGQPKAEAVLSPETAAFWAPHFGDGNPTLIVYGAPLFLKVANSFFRDTHVNRAEDLNQSPQVRSVIAALTPSEIRPIYHFTGVGESEAIFHVTRVLAAGHAALDVKRSNAVSWDDLKNRHVVMIGGRKFNPQIPDLPFKPKFQADKGKVVNLRLEGKEAAEYATVRRTSHGEVTEDYAIISVYPGFSPHTRLVALESASTEGTLAVAEFVTRPDTLRELIQRKVPLDRADPIRAFQVVIGARFNDGVVVRLNYVTHALLQ